MKTPDQWSVWLKGNFPEMSLSERNKIIDFANMEETKKQTTRDYAFPSHDSDFFRGLSKREMFAIAAMQGLLSNSHYIAKLEDNMQKAIVYDMNAMCAKEAVDMADELLKQLDKIK